MDGFQTPIESKSNADKTIYTYQGGLLHDFVYIIYKDNPRENKIVKAAIERDLDKNVCITETVTQFTHF